MQAQILPHNLVIGSRVNFNDDTKLPITVAMVKTKDGSYSETDTSRDAEIQRSIRAVIDYFESAYRFYIIQQQREMFFDCFPKSPLVPIDARNVKSIVEIGYYPSNWNKTDPRTLLEFLTDYDVRNEVGIYTATVCFINNEAEHPLFPKLQNIRLVFEAGFDDTYVGLPYDLQEALLEHTIRFVNRLKGDDCEECETLLTPAIQKVYTQYGNKIHFNEPYYGW